MDSRKVHVRDLGIIEYGDAWKLQEELLQSNVQEKLDWNREAQAGRRQDNGPSTSHHLLFCEHPPVYTLGKSGKFDHLLLQEEELQQKGISFYHTNRGGDITFHGHGQVVGYPILDLEAFKPDIGKYLRDLEEVIILTLADYGIKGERSAGETGVWLDPGDMSKARKICAMGVRCSRWVTMHGFALNVNTDLRYFDHIIPCGISGKKVASLSEELGRQVSMDEVQSRLSHHFSRVFECTLIRGGS